MTYYSALHYAAKAEKSAKLAEQYATQATQFSGKVIQIGFDGFMENGQLVFKHSPAGIDIPYDLLDDYEYEIDMAYSGSDLADNVELVVKNGADTINFVSALHRDSTTPVTVNEMKQVMRYDERTGYRWLFKAAFKVTPAGHKVFLLYPVISLASSGLEIGDIGIAPFGIDESLNLRRYLNGQVISQEQFKSFTDKIKKAVELYPSLSATEENWQAEVTASVLGQCGKFVIDDTAGTIRLPKVVNINSLQDLALIGGIMAESLPNITGSFNAAVPKDETEGAFYGEGGAWVTASVTSTNGGATHLDASRSSTAYQDGAPVQQEAIQYPYFIQVATGSEESLPAISEYKLNNPNFFGQSMWTDVTPNNASWLLSNGAFHSGATYGDYYQWLLKIYNGTETVEGVSVKGVNGEYTDYDWVINTADSTFRLPLLNGKEDLPDYGNKIELTGTTTFNRNGLVVVRGAHTGSGSNYILLNGNYVQELNTNVYGTSSTARDYGSYFVKKEDVLTFEGSFESPFYFYPAKGNGSLYFYVGDTLQDPALINAGQVLTALATKTDKTQAAAASMPSSRYIDLTLGASGTIYTAPANGYFSISKVAGGDWYYVNLSVLKDGVETFTEIADILYEHFQDAYRTSPCTSKVSVKKGQKMYLTYNASGALNWFRFIYAEGDK